MELKRPDPEQAYWGLRAMKTVAMADGALDASELHMRESIQWILGTNTSAGGARSHYAGGSGAVSDVTTGT
jgi:tellurite resistance protein